MCGLSNSVNWYQKDREGKGTCALWWGGGPGHWLQWGGWGRAQGGGLR